MNDGRRLIPTAWQRAIYRNYGTVRTERLAAALKKSDVERNREKLLSYVRSERALTEELYRLIVLDPKIGFEMTNHYYYDANVLWEKQLNLLEIEDRLCR